jgi:hypothetical protein
MRLGLLCFKSIQWCYRLICSFLGPKIAYFGTEAFVAILQATYELLGFLPWSGKIVERYYSNYMFYPMLFGVISYQEECLTFLKFGRRESRIVGRKVEAWFRAGERYLRTGKEEASLARQALQKARVGLVEYEESLEERKTKG